LQSVLKDIGTSFASSGLFSNNDPSALLLAILQSRTLAEHVIERLDLLPRLFATDWDAVTKQWQTDEPPTMADAVKALGKLVSSTSNDKQGTITITAIHTDPQLAAAIANQYIEALQQILNEKAFTLAKKNRAFLEAQLHQTQQALTTAEETVRQFEQTSGIVDFATQAQAAVNILAGLESEIMAKERQLAVSQLEFRGPSREIYLVQGEIKELRAQLAQLQQSTPDASAALADAGHNQKPPVLSKRPNILPVYPFKDDGLDLADIK
jgi:uncharacterized protein involved in exopolysaccharide biosynthesis